MPLRYELFIKDLLFLVESGEIPMARIDDAVERILRVKFVAGIFEHPFSDRSLLDLVGCKACFQLVRLVVVHICDYYRPSMGQIFLLFTRET